MEALIDKRKLLNYYKEQVQVILPKKLANSKYELEKE